MAKRQTFNEGKRRPQPFPHTSELCRQIAARESGFRSTISGLLTDAADAVEGCPDFTLAEMCYILNRLASCRRLLSQNEWGAAGYQMTELSRKLLHNSALNRSA